MHQVNHEFCKLIDNSPVINYHLDLFSEGTASNPLTIQDRRQKLEAYCSRWENFDCAEQILLTQSSLPNVQNTYVDQGFLIYNEYTGDKQENICFVYIPSRMMGTPLED
jgi:hypothetical protein